MLYQLTEWSSFGCTSLLALKQSAMFVLDKVKLVWIINDSFAVFWNFFPKRWFYRRFTGAWVGHLQAATYAYLSQLGYCPSSAARRKWRNERFQVQAMCVVVRQQPPALFLPASVPPSSRSPLPSSSLTLLLIREESFHYLLRLGCQSQCPWPKFVVLPRHIGGMISGVISPPLREAFIPPHGPPYLQARRSLTGEAAALLSLLHTLPLFTLADTSSCASKCLCSLLSQVRLNTIFSFSPPYFQLLSHKMLVRWMKSGWPFNFRF